MGEGGNLCAETGEGGEGGSFGEIWDGGAGFKIVEVGKGAFLKGETGGSEGLGIAD